MNKLIILKSALQQIIDDIDTGNSNSSEEELTELIEYINKTTQVENKLSKYQACKYLNVSRATFDNWVRDGKLPEGRKEQGFTEKFWYKRDLLPYKKDYAE